MVDVATIREALRTAIHHVYEVRHLPTGDDYATALAALEPIPDDARLVGLSAADWKTLDRILGDYQQLGARGLIEPWKATSIAADIRRQIGEG